MLHVYIYWPPEFTIIFNVYNDDKYNECLLHLDQIYFLSNQ